MFTTEEKKFYADTAWGASGLSGCDVKQGAVLARDHFILSCGYNKKIVQGCDYEISAIFDAVFAARDIDISGTAIFTTYFPALSDLILIISTGITSVYFFGEIRDPKTVELTNKLAENLIPLEIIQLK